MTRQRNGGLRKVCGCPRRVWAKCDHSWYFSFKFGPVHHRFSIDKHLGRHVDNKSDAEDEAAEIRKAIKAGTFGQPAPRQDMTLRQLADTYLERYVQVERKATEQAFKYALDTICRTVLPHPTGGDAPFGDWRLTDVVTDTVERFREVRRGQGVGPVGVNRNLGSLRALYNWAIRTGYVERSPFKRQSEPVVRLSDEPSRSRRLNADIDEEGKLLAACGPHLRAVVEAALESGMRRGEILSLQWNQIEGLTLEGKNNKAVWAPRAELVLPWAKTKTRRDRRIPISSRLRGILEMRRLDPAGKPLAGDAYALGNAIGQRVKDVKRAWMTAVLKAHGHESTYTETANLSPESRAAFESIDLHFHDLRREAGSRWLEGGVPLHTIRDWLGHTSIAQTSTYLAGTIQTQHDAMAQFEARRVSLQKLAKRSKTGGRKSLSTAERANRKPNKTGVGRERPIM